MKVLDEATKAQLKFEFRDMYRKIGTAASLQCLYEIIESGILLVEVITEEMKNVNNH